MSSNIKCTCGHLDDFTAFETSINGVWKCPACGEVKDARESYKGEEFLTIMAERVKMAEFLICIDTIERNIRIKKRHTKGRIAPITHHTDEPRALPSCSSSSLSGAAPRAPHTPAHQDIKHPIIEAHYGV